MLKFKDLNEKQKNDFLIVHLDSEVIELKNAYELVKRNDNDGNIERHNLEVFLLHARVLSDFFRNKKSEKDDAIVNDYTSNFKCNLGSIDIAIKDINKRLTHLTYTRMEPMKDKWNYQIMYDEIKKTYDIFLKQRDYEKSQIHKRIF